MHITNNVIYFQVSNLTEESAKWMLGEILDAENPFSFTMLDNGSVALERGTNEEVERQAHIGTMIEKFNKKRIIQDEVIDALYDIYN